jgi:hypothetical protein
MGRRKVKYMGRVAPLVVTGWFWDHVLTQNQRELVLTGERLLYLCLKTIYPDPTSYEYIRPV